jgi:hypothetical protein
VIPEEVTGNVHLDIPLVTAQVLEMLALRSPTACRHLGCGRCLRAVLRRRVLCCTVPHGAVVCCAAPWCAVLCRPVLWCAVPWGGAALCRVLHDVVQRRGRTALPNSCVFNEKAPIRTAKTSTNVGMVKV